MGLCLSVGFLADLSENDPESYADYCAIFDALNHVLAEKRLSAHREPSKVDPNDAISYDMYGYSGLHYLRRIAAHLAYSQAIPRPGDDGSSNDAFLKRYYEESCNPQPGSGVLSLSQKRATAPQFNFNHLIQHSDCEGFYLPIDFEDVIFPDSSLKIPGEMIGSSQRLLKECTLLANALRIPSNIAPESDELWEAANDQGHGDAWRPYGVESFTCVRLIHACQASIRSGAALVFC